jgi:hypothetical protein
LRKAKWLFTDPTPLLNTLKNSCQLKKIDKRKEWWSQPSNFLDYGTVKTTDSDVRLFIVLERLNGTTNQLQRRTVCVALAELHAKNTALDDLVSRIRNSSELTSLGDDKEVKKRLSFLLLAGRKWKEIIQLCASIRNSGTDSEFSGVLWLLGNGSRYVNLEVVCLQLTHISWEKADERTCREALTGLEDVFYERCKNLALTVNSTLTSLKEGECSCTIDVQITNRTKRPDFAPVNLRTTF